MGAVKALGRDAALRVAEMESTRERIGPNGQPVHQIESSFNDHQLSCWPCEIEAELSSVEAEIWSGRGNHECRVSFPDRVVPRVRHIENSAAIDGDAAGIVRARGAVGAIAGQVCGTAGSAGRSWLAQLARAVREERSLA